MKQAEEKKKQMEGAFIASEKIEELDLRRM
jgi:hypothetical protein